MSRWLSFSSGHIPAKATSNTTRDSGDLNCPSHSRPRACIVNRDADDFVYRQTRPLEDRRLPKRQSMRKVRRFRLLDREHYAEGMTMATAP